MRNLQKTRRIQIIAVAFVALAGSSALIGYGFRDGINLFRSPSQVASEPPEANEVFRLGGLVLEGTRTPSEGGRFSFVVTDCIVDVPVDFVGNEPPPALFGEGTGTILTGKLVDGRFQATEILAKHDESYQPREVTDALEQEGACQHPEAS